jgi:membrane protease YdiL (CAAX protease family)
VTPTALPLANAFNPFGGTVEVNNQRGELKNRSRLALAVLFFALLFPGFMSWLEYAAIPGGEAGPSPVLQVIYVFGKAFQIVVPILYVSATIGRIPCPGRPTCKGIELGLAFGLLVALGTIALYFIFLRDTSVFRESPIQIKAKLDEFGLNSPTGFALFAVGITIPHSLLEEYYWRWFIFGQLRSILSLRVAILLSSIAFGAFHIFQLTAFLPGHIFSAVLPFAACTAVGGAIWAWLYHRTGSVYAPWLSHLIVDASLFVIGYDLFFVRA